jgi:hypothetical protein
VPESVDHQREVAVVEARQGVAEIRWQPGCQAEDPPFPAGAGQGACGEAMATAVHSIAACAVMLPR